MALTVVRGRGGPYSIHYLAVGGGGGGGASMSDSNVGTGGGGGGGVVLEGEYIAELARQYTITVGAGGAGCINNSSASVKGGDTSIDSVVIALGGGRGGSYHSDTSHTAANPEFDVAGTGGGGSYNARGSFGLGGTRGGDNSQYILQNLNGSPSDSSGAVGSGGGGGAAGNGYGGTAVSGGEGGIGKTTTIITTTQATDNSVGHVSSSVLYFGGGGGGGSEQNTAGSGGLGGAGAGSNSTAAGTAGTANTGGGGGGGGNPSGSDGGTGGAGGSGLVILRMPTASYSGTTTGSPTVLTSGTDTILLFKSSGSYTG